MTIFIIQLNDGTEFKLTCPDYASIQWAEEVADTLENAEEVKRVDYKVER